ncbi:helix-turn-helix transcriptional regulator [Acetobacter fallax]|uniref:helix-turn-helix transcriptional regulator n=1 Tax=Acetobacter fallax TaxID=1737473 RepID=UPI00156AC03F|nr:helix-turn-helix transcriptional regulator [Acetobacter fallax]
MLVKSDVNVSYAAFQVGYESPSRFSREYVRSFAAARCDGNEVNRGLTQVREVLSRGSEVSEKLC